MMKGKISRRPTNKDDCRNNVNDSPKTSSPPRAKWSQKMSAYERAKKVYEQIQDEKAKEKVVRQQERERRQAALQKYLHLKKKRSRLLRMCNKKGQPNLGAQMEIILEKLEKEEK